MPQSRIIHEDENCLVVYQPGQSPFTLITFGSIGDRPKGDWFWGKATASKLNLDSIGIVPKGNHRYPSDIVTHLVPAINANAQPTRIGYGFSMGAYGALKNGRLLNLTHVLALSPVNYALTSAHIRKIIWDRNFCPERNHGPLISRQELAPINLQILDTFFLLDSEQGDLFASAGGIQTISTPFTDHFSIGLLRGTDNFNNVINLLLKEDFASIHAVFNKNRRSAPERASNLARASLARGNRTRANNLWKSALDKGVKSETVERARISGLVEYGRRYLSSNSGRDPQYAEAFIERISLEFPESLRLQRELGHWCMVYSAPQAALIPLRRAVEIAQADVECWLALGHALHAAGKTEEALGTLHEALEFCDRHEKIVSLMDHLKLVSRLQAVEKGGAYLMRRFRLESLAMKVVSIKKYFSRISWK